RSKRDWSSDVCSSDLDVETQAADAHEVEISADPLEEWLGARAGKLLGVHVAGDVAMGTGNAWSIAISDGDTAITRDLATISAAEEQVLAAWLADDTAPKAFHESKDEWHALDGRGLPLAG